MKLEFSGRIFEKFSNIKFHENPFSESGVIACGRKARQADKHYDANSHFAILLSRLKALANVNAPSLIPTSVSSV